MVSNGLFSQEDTCKEIHVEELLKKKQEETDFHATVKKHIYFIYKFVLIWIQWRRTMEDHDVCGLLSKRQFNSLAQFCLHIILEALMRFSMWLGYYIYMTFNH